MKINPKPCTAVPATHPAGVGHNGPPLDDADILFEFFGPAQLLEIQPFHCGAPWTAHANDAELRELALNEFRIAVKTRALKDMKAKRRQIMNRCIRRMRRADGKT